MQQTDKETQRKRKTKQQKMRQTQRIARNKTPKSPPQLKS